MFIINLIPLHVFVLLLMQRYSRRVYIGKLHTHKQKHKQLNQTITFSVGLDVKNSPTNCTVAELETDCISGRLPLE